MAGYFVVLGDIKDEKGDTIKRAEDILCNMLRYGTYSTNLSIKEGSKKWSKPKVATFADYFGMKENDYIFFFSNRKIYGVGKLVNIGQECKYWAFEGANRPTTYSQEQVDKTKLTADITPENRCICFFRPVFYYAKSIDMDEALTSYPASFKSLRVIQNRTFIKLDDEEADALFAVLNRKNVSTEKNDPNDWTPPTFDESMHNIAKTKISAHPEYYSFNIKSLLANYECWEGDGIREEMVIEAAVIDALTKKENNLVFDKLAYVSHQVSASPAKPVEYMEWIDIFGYSVSDYLIEQKIPITFAINQYYVIEIKRDALALPAPKRGKETAQIRKNKAVANQLMKYVDWVAKNYASGNYPMVKAILIANDFDTAFIDYCKKMCIRNYNNGYRDSTPAVWENFELIKYSFDGTNITFEKTIQ